MNPFRWELRHRVALALSAMIGATINVVVGYLAAGRGNTLTDWLFYLGLGPPAAAPWAALGAFVGGAIFYVWRISALPTGNNKSGAMAASGEEGDHTPTCGRVRTPRPSGPRFHLAVAVAQEILAVGAFVVVFALTCMPFVLFQREFDRHGLAAVPFVADTATAAWLIGAFGAASGVIGLALGRLVYKRLRSDSHDGNTPQITISPWVEALLSTLVALAILAVLAFLASN